jgi:hypothetical protein
MSTISVTRPRRSWWRLALLLLVVVPFLPEIAIYAVTGLARITGCEVADSMPCMFGRLEVSAIIANRLREGIWIARWMGAYGVAAAWLVLCYLVITFGWRKGRSPLKLAVTLVFAALPYFGPYLSIRHLENRLCIPNAGGVLYQLDGRSKEPDGGSPIKCVVFGGDVGDPAHQTVRIYEDLWLTGALVALVAFVSYAIVSAIIRRFSAIGWIKLPREG